MGGGKREGRGRQTGETKEPKGQGRGEVGRRRNRENEW